MFNIIGTTLSGLKIIETPHFTDGRGMFRKFFSSQEFNSLGLSTDFCEDYYSVNAKNVIRGMHFQTPPHEHDKLVYVAHGSIIDVCVDIRNGSHTYGKFFSIELSADIPRAIYIPKGFAHGFLSLEDDTVVHYLQTTCHCANSDAGIHYDSFGFNWNTENPIVSERDKSHPFLKDFVSPFSCPKKVALTGSTGLIGKEAVSPLKKDGFDVLCIMRKECDLFDKSAVQKFFEKNKPEYLLHFAWVTGGDYLSNPLNEKLVEASMNMLKAFAANGGKRAVFAGTCFEYDFQDAPLKETDSLNPLTIYAKCKVRLYEEAKKFCEDNGISFAWGRIFYVYGHNEKEGRFVQSVAGSLLHDKEVSVKYGQLVRDYMYSKDIACAFVKIMESNVQDAVNVCTGHGISLGDFALEIAKRLRKENLVNVKKDITEQPIKIIGDNTKLINEVGYKTMFTAKEGIEQILTYTHPHYYNLLYFNNLHHYNSTIHLRICGSFCKEAA